MINDENREAYRAFLSWERLKNNAESRKQFEERYKGIWTEASYARAWHESTHDMSALPEWARGNIDWASKAKKMFSTDFYAISIEKGAYDYYVYVFVKRVPELQLLT